MNTKIVTEDNLDRLALAIMVKYNVGYEEARRILSKMRLRLICDASIGESAAKQAALLTAINVGKRAFHGGVFVSMPGHVKCLLPWPSFQPFNSMVSMMGGCFVMPESDPFTQTIYFGSAPKPVEDSLFVYCSGWRGGVAPAGSTVSIPSPYDFATGGVLAGALAVARGFLRVSGLSSRSLEEPQGISIWRPDLNWLDPAADGPELESLPKALWMLGLGHLGQAYIWNLGLLPYQSSKDTTFLLQDFDTVVEGNYSSQLLCEKNNIGRKKTRVCSDWLEARGFNTVLTERPFDGATKRTDDEPFIACCGFDASKPRRILEDAGFDLIVECALGADSARFDRIILHTFPDARRKPAVIWADDKQSNPDQRIIEAFRTKEDCGILAETLAKKAISSSFVGAVAGALVTGEILRALNGGVRCELVQLQLRHNDDLSVILKDENYQVRAARSGFCPSSVPELLVA
ncbi:MAG TPA: hypothetical protein VNN22_06665 [Verrucomicrobiae bacterium]|nr:hypothetical protein [Verrucomicrobiae bacterium]